jgi:DNA polymerase IV (DinB-like DNA polymerase)
MKSDRIIMHLDMDYFFAAIEENRQPELRGRPLVVGADPKKGRGRGVVSTCNYEARMFGIRPGMPISQAYRLCPDARYLPVDFESYRKVSDRIMHIARKYAAKTEQTSIDEVFLDLSRAGSYEKAAEIAEKIRKEIFEKENLTASAGIGWNKTISKLATDLKKPNGLAVVKPDEIREKIWPLPVGKIPGIGAKAEETLKGMGIRAIEDLAKTPVNRLIEELGSVGFDFHHLAQGMDESELSEEWEPKSFSREHTFEADTDDSELLLKTIEKLAKTVHRDATDYGVSFRTVTVKARYEDFETHTRSRTTKSTNSYEAVLSEAKELIKPFLFSSKKIRLVGLKLSKFERKTGQKSLKEF